jgi:hypothetical protein
LQFRRRVAAITPGSTSGPPSGSTMREGGTPCRAERAASPAPWRRCPSEANCPTSPGPGFRCPARRTFRSRLLGRGGIGPRRRRSGASGRPLGHPAPGPVRVDRAQSRLRLGRGVSPRRSAGLDARGDGRLRDVEAADVDVDASARARRSGRAPLFGFEPTFGPAAWVLNCQNASKCRDRHAVEYQRPALMAVGRYSYA